MKYLLLLILIFFKNSYALPKCIKKGSSWNCEELETIFDISSWNECQNICRDRDCSSFTWYGPSATLKNACKLFKGSCIQQESNEETISGPATCPTCSIDFACQVDGSNYVNIVQNIQSELECQLECQKRTDCHFYTFYTGDHELFANQCHLSKFCEVYKRCQGYEDTASCYTGPKGCRDSNDFCQKGEAIVAYGDYSGSLSNIAIFKWGKETHNVYTMGCQAKINLLAVGGGGASGHHGMWFFKGGGGSGYLDAKQQIIPYSNE